jgi:hypothetical protein
MWKNFGRIPDRSTHTKSSPHQTEVVVPQEPSAEEVNFLAVSVVSYPESRGGGQQPIFDRASSPAKPVNLYLKSRAWIELFVWNRMSLTTDESTVGCQVSIGSQKNFWRKSVPQEPSTGWLEGYVENF